MSPAAWVVAALAAVSLAAPAFAEPSTLPQHDVSVVYRLGGAMRDAVPGGLPETVRLLWDAGRQRLRVEPQGRTQTLLIDLAVPQAELIDSGLRSVITLPIRPKDIEPLTLHDAHLTRRGQAVVAGLPCTEYAAESRRGHGTVCLTSDGVALRAVGQVDGREGSLVAVSVGPGPFAANLFESPPGFMRLAIPGLARFR